MQMQSKRVEVFAEEVFEVPFSGGGEAAFEADEEGAFAGFALVAEFLDGAVLDMYSPRQMKLRNGVGVSGW